MDKDKLIGEIKRMVANFGDFYYFPHVITSEGIKSIDILDDADGGRVAVTVFNSFENFSVEELKEVLEEMYIIHFQTTVDVSQFN